MIAALSNEDDNFISLLARINIIDGERESRNETAHERWAWKKVGTEFKSRAGLNQMIDAVRRRALPWILPKSSRSGQSTAQRACVTCELDSSDPISRSERRYRRCEQLETKRLLGAESKY